MLKGPQHAQVYIRPRSIPELPEVLFLLLYSLHDAYSFQRALSLLERRDPKAPDAVALSRCCSSSIPAMLR